MPASPVSISVVIPVYNGGNSFKQCLESIAASVRAPDEVIVVSDGDTDGSWQVAEAAGAKVLRLPNSGGPARARNVGAKAAQSDILFFIDADVTVHPETIDRVEQIFQQQPELAALIGSYDDAPGADNFLSQYKNLFHHYTHQVSSETASTFWGACGAIRRSAFQAVDGFDEGYRKPCIEDIELGYRLKRAGYSIRLCKDIWVKHLKRWEPVSLLRAEIFYRALPWSELMLRDRRFDADLNLSNANRVSVILTFLLVGSLGLSVLMTELLWVAAGCAIALLIVNASVYQFFYKKRGLLFALRVVPWHWFYFLYGGAAFAYCMLKHYWSRLRLSEPTAV
ncbi:MAG: glycosyltransferase [Cyanobacteria bacterium J06636_16]